MNYLELVQTLTSESGVVPNAGPAGDATAIPQSIDAATGLVLKMKGWIAREWRKIQVARDDWRWMRVFFTKTTSTLSPIIATSGIAESLPAASGRWGRFIPLTDTGDSAWSIARASLGVSDESPMTYVPFEEFYITRMRGTQPDAQKPYEFTINHNGNVVIWPTQDEPVTIRGLYYRAPQVLSAGSDIPEMPERFHDLIWLRAIMAADIYDEAPARLSYWQQEADRLWAALVHEQTEAPYIGNATVSYSNWMPGYPI